MVDFADSENGGKAFGLQKGGNALMGAEAARQVQEVQASLMIAKSFPRDEVNAFNKIMTACERSKLADDAMYAYPRGSEIVTGPSIRLAEVIAQSWGNIQFGIRELSQENGFSEMEAFAWDVETNTRVVKAFRVPHIRYSKKYGNKSLTDPRDIYEMTANQGARRLRACILGVIPGDVTDAAVKKCEETLSSAHKEPLKDRIRQMVSLFSSKFQITQEMIEIRLGHKIEVTSEKEMVTLRKIFKSLDDNMASREEFFEISSDGISQDAKAEELNKRLSKKDDKKTSTKKAAPAEEEKQEPAAESKNETENQSEDDVDQATKDQAERDEKIEHLKQLAERDKTSVQKMCGLMPSQLMELDKEKFDKIYAEQAF